MRIFYYLVIVIILTALLEIPRAEAVSSTDNVPTWPTTNGTSSETMVTVSQMQAYFSTLFAPSADAVQSFAPTTGQTISVANDTTHNILVAINPSGSLLALTTAMPSTPFIGQRVYLSSNQVITTVTMTAVPTILGAISTLIVGGFATYEYDGTYWRRVG